MSITRAELNAVKSDGTVVTCEPLKGCKLAVATYYFIAQDADAAWASAHFKWDSALVATITVEDSNLPRKFGDMPSGGSTDDVTDVDANTGASAGNWMQENATTAYIPVVGGTVTNQTVTIPGGTAGGAMMNMSNIGSRRMRFKVVVTTAGQLRCGTHSKMA